MFSAIQCWIVALVSSLFWLYKSGTLRKVYLAEQLPGPLAFPIIGNGHLFVNKPMQDTFATWYNLITSYGSMMRLWFGDILLINVSHPMDVEAMLNGTKFIDKSEMYNLLDDWLNTGLLTSKAQKWHRRRKIITPAFHFKILESYVDVFDHHSNIFVESLAKFTPTDAIDMYKLISLYTLDVITETAMGTCINAQLDKDHEYVHAVEEVSHLISRRMFHPFLRLKFFYQFSSLRRETNKCLAIMHNLSESLIAIRKKTYEAQLALETKDEYMPSEDVYDNGSAKRKYNLIDILLRARIDDQPLSNLDIREEVDTFMFEGHDTTASAVLFSLYNLARYPQVQGKCFEEICAVIGTDRSAPVGMNQLNSLHYMELVIKETLRLYPSVQSIGRKIAEESNINGKILPAESHVIFLLYKLHRNPEVFEEPDEFRPERFTKEAFYQGKGKAFAYIPFSAGPRNCVGQKFADLELKSVLSKLLRWYEFTLHPDSQRTPTMVSSLITRPLEPLKFHIRRRQYAS